MVYTADEVVHLFEGADSAICMQHSDDDLGFEEVEVVDIPYYNHAPECEDFEVLEGNNYI